MHLAQRQDIRKHVYLGNLSLVYSKPQKIDWNFKATRHQDVVSKSRPIYGMPFILKRSLILRRQPILLQDVVISLGIKINECKFMCIFDYMDSSCWCVALFEIGLGVSILSWQSIPEDLKAWYCELLVNVRRGFLFVFCASKKYVSLEHRWNKNWDNVLLWFWRTSEIKQCYWNL